MVSFDNTKIAFAYKTTRELKKAKFLFASMGNASLTKIGINLTKFAFNVGLPINGLLKKTLYKQFCGGENLQETSITASNIYKYGVGVILDYGVEGKLTEEEFDHTANEFINTIQFAKGKNQIPFISIKVTGFARFALLEKMDANQTLNPNENAEWERVCKRMDTICKTAVESNVMLLIDAEETWIQDPIDKLALKMMQKYNTEQCFIFNTYQMYRHDRLAFIKKELAFASFNNFILGAKIVRGAYMEKERARAIEKNYPSPIQPTKLSTDNDYNQALRMCIDNHKNCSVFIGTHNEASCYKAVDLVQKYNIDPKSKAVYFSQLYGMSDNISFNLANSNFNVSKYLPYGLVHDVVPYLMRRAQENTSVAGQTGRELTLINKELRRRKKKD